MKPKLLHQQAMDLSFKAKQALRKEAYEDAFNYYQAAAKLENQVADFYLDRYELEPTRGIMLRSATFLNLKAGSVDKAKEYIFHGLLTCQDETLKSQFQEALEIAVSLSTLSPELASKEYNHLYLLRQRSIHYILEPVAPKFGVSISLKNLRDFTDGYLKSLLAYAKSKFLALPGLKRKRENDWGENLIDPLITHTAYGSFKFSIAQDFRSQKGESETLRSFKSGIVSHYHHDVFTNPLMDPDIQQVKQEYTSQEVKEIFRPLVKLKAEDSPLRIGYWDPDSLKKKLIEHIAPQQKEKLFAT